MRDEHDGAVELRQGLLEDVHRVDVEVVGGLVKAQQWRGRHEHLGKRQTRLLTTGEHRHLLLDVVALEEERAQKLALLRRRPTGGGAVHLLHHGVLGVELLKLVLGVVGHAHVVAELAGARVGRLVAGDHLHEGGLARAVGAHQGDALAAVELERDVGVHVLVAVALGHVLELHHEVGGTRRLREVEMDLLLLLGQHDALGHELVELFDAVLRLTGLGGLVAELLDELLEVGDLAVLLGLGGLELLERRLALLDEGGVVAGVHGELAVFDGGHVVDHAVEEGTVVAHDEDGAVVARKEALEPTDAGKVEVVGRLVEQQHVGVAKQQLGELDAHLPAAGELGDVAAEVGDGKAQAGEDGAGPRLNLIAVGRLEAVAGTAVLLEELLVVLHVGGVGQQVLELGDALLKGADLGGRGEHLIDDRAARDLDGLLLEVAHRGVLCKVDVARVGGLDAHDHLEHRGLARAVGAYQGIALAGVDLKRRVAEKGASTEGLREFVDLYDHEARFQSSSREGLAAVETDRATIAQAPRPHTLTWKALEEERSCAPHRQQKGLEGMPSRPCENHWWAQQDSNLQHRDYESPALTVAP